ncbi:BURP domain-containing protein 16-like isoform X3 [Solanum stenotomum]|uniref:BURP domain-containing protein 16-like isoform X3 n=1 Tax=Solanum stenotomum TaxID=172797 RepID=UPI0020D13094|nr:BURP domain-containing protein 16-like isoform X3 [Solanum stenotomum]
MATSYWFMFFLLSVLSLFASSTCNSITYVGSNQLKFWKENVVNEMPQALVSKLSPMNMIDSKYYTSLVSKNSFSFNAQSCLLADIFCTSETNAQTSKIPEQAKVYASKLPNQAKVYPSKIPDQAKVYASKLPNQAKVYPSNLPDQAKVYASKTYATSHSNSHHLGEVSFFRVSILKPGNTIHLDNLVNPYPHRSFLPSQIASKISINSNHLQHLFPQTFTSPFTKDTTETTILNCNAPTLKGEVKTCAKSLEEMIEFSKTTLKQNHLISLTTDSIQGSGQNLKIEKFHKINSQKSVSCHEIFLPFATYFCHLLSSTNIYAVELVDLNTNVHVNTAMVVCHMDTSSWPADHPVFKKLNFSPGKGEVCHWMSQTDLVWVGDDAHA